MMFHGVLESTSLGELRIRLLISPILMLLYSRLEEAKMIGHCKPLKVILNQPVQLAVVLSSILPPLVVINGKRLVMPMDII